MKVKELIAKLLEMPQEKDVEILLDGSQYDLDEVCDDRATVLIVAVE